MFRGGFFPADSVVGSAMSAVDIALWDIRGKASASRPTAPGGLVRGQGDLLPAQPLRRRPGRFLEHVRRPPRAGSSSASTCRRGATCWSRARRSATGPGSRRSARSSATTSGSAWTSTPGGSVPGDRAGERAGAVPDLLPGRPDPLGEHQSVRRVRASTRIPIAAGEQCAGKWAFRELIEDDLIDYCQGRSFASPVA